MHLAAQERASQHRQDDVEDGHRKVPHGVVNDAGDHVVQKETDIQHERGAQKEYVSVILVEQKAVQKYIVLCTGKKVFVNLPPACEADSRPIRDKQNAVQDPYSESARHEEHVRQNQQHADGQKYHDDGRKDRQIHEEAQKPAQKLLELVFHAFMVVLSLIEDGKIDSINIFYYTAI